MRGFKTSGRYGIIGVFVVAGLCILIATTVADPTDPNPKLAYGLIFGVIGLYLVGLFFFQTRDVNRVAAGDARGSSGGPREIEDPTTMEDGELWAAMAVKPIDSGADDARAEMWGVAKRSIHLGMLVCVLIFLTVPPIYLFDTFVPLLIGTPVIVGVALYGTIRAVGSGGDIDQGFENTDVAMRPLGLKLSARPDLQFQSRMPPMWGANARLQGPMILEGKRHGRDVTVHQEGGNSEVLINGSVPSFKAKTRDGRIKGEKDTPDAVAAVLAEIPNSTRWKGVRVHGGSAGIAVQREHSLQDWLCDLWLAERLAARL
jgi:hypothetical protein